VAYLRILPSSEKQGGGFYGFTEEGLDFIINYDIKSRMGQESGEAEGESCERFVNSPKEYFMWHRRLSSVMFRSGHLGGMHFSFRNWQPLSIEEDRHQSYRSVVEHFRVYRRSLSPHQQPYSPVFPDPFDTFPLHPLSGLETSYAGRG